MRYLSTIALLLFGGSLFGLSVIQTFPLANGIETSPDDAIVIIFDDELDLNTISTSSVKAFGRWSGPVDVQLSLSIDGYDLVIGHLEEFFFGEYVMVQVTSDVQSASGNSLDHGYSFGFWVRSLPGSLDLVDVEHIEVRQEGETFIQCYGAYAGDLNHDGYGDLTVVNEDVGDMRIFLSDQGSFSDFTVHDLPDGNKPSSNEGADFNGDGEIDLVIGNTQGDMISILMSEGSGSFADEVIYDAAQGVRGVTILDLEGDGDMDVVSANRQGNNLTILRNDGTGAFENLGQVGTPVGGETAIISADMNNDGIADIVVGGYTSDEIVILLNDGTGTFTASSTTATGDGPWMITMGDVNGDGNIDIASANSGANQLAIHLGDGEGGLAAADNAFTGQFPLAIDLGDLDGDGDLDVITSNYSGGTFTLYENLGTGEFDNERTYLAEIAGSCAIFHDRNHDGVMDITGIDELADVLIFYENEPTGITDLVDLGLSVSPNPFRDEFTIRFEEPSHASEWQIVDIMGRSIKTIRVPQGLRQINVGIDSPSGIYLLKDAFTGNIITRLIKK